MSEPKERKTPNRFRITSIVIVVLMLIGIFGALIPPSLITVSAAPNTHTWDGGGLDVFAGTHDNWVSDIAPEAGDSVVFDAGALPCTWNLSIALASFTISAGYSGTISQVCDFSITSYSQAAGTFTPSATHDLTNSGGFTKTGGTLTEFFLQIIFTGTADIDLDATAYFRSLTVNTGSHMTLKTADLTVDYGGIYVQVGGEITISTGLTLLLDFPTPDLVNSGVISGAGTFKITCLDANKTITIGTVTCITALELHNTATQSCKVTLSANGVVGAISVYSTNATYTMSLVLSTFDLSATTIIIGVRGNITQGTGAITCTNFIQNGVGSVFIPGAGLVTVSENFTHTVGTVVQELLRLRMTGIGMVATFLDDRPVYLHITGDCTILGLGFASGSVFFGVVPGATLIVDLGAVMRMTLDTVFVFWPSDTTSFTNDGVITGPGIFKIQLYHNSPTIIFGTVNAPLVISEEAGAVVARTLSLGANTDLGGSLVIQSDDPAKKATLHLNNYSLSIPSILIYTSGVLNATSSVINLRDSLNFTGGSDGFISGTSTVRFSGTHAYVALGSGQEFYNLSIDDNAFVRFNQTTKINGIFEAYGEYSQGPIEIQSTANAVFIHDQLNTSIESINGIVLVGDHYTMSANSASGGVIITEVSFAGSLEPQISFGTPPYPIIPGGSIVGFGDSIMVVDYTDVLHDLTGMTVINAGHPGENTGLLLARFNAEVVVPDPDYVVIVAGANDITLDILQTEANLTSMYNLAIAAGIKVIATTITPATFQEPSDFYYNNHAILNCWIQAQASAMIQVLDFDLLMADPTNNRNINVAYSDDGVHPNYAGACRMANQTYSQVFLGMHTTYLTQSIPASWTMSATSTVTFTLSGLDLSVGYKVYVDGQEISRHHSGSSLITFSYSAWSEHEFEVRVWDPYKNYENYASMLMGIGLIIGIGAIFYQMVNRSRR